MPLAAPTTTLTVVQGAQLTRTLQGKNADGSTPTNFDGSEELSGTIFLAQNEAAIIQFSPSWFNPTLCQFTIALTTIQTAALEIDTNYNVQVTATSNGLPFVIGWVYLQILPAAGSQSAAVPPDLISGPYAAQMLQNLTLSESQLEQIPNLITSCSNAWTVWCNRRFDQATYVQECDVELDGYVRLNNIPINQIYRVQTQPQTALTVSNNAAQVAYIGWTITGDIASGQTVTGMTATTILNGVQTIQTVVYSANETISSLATAIAALGNGWSAIVDSTLGLWPVTEICNGAIAKGATINDTPGDGATFDIYTANLTDARFHPDDGALTGMVWTGRQYTDVGPRWGPGWQDFTSGINAGTGKVKVTYNGGFATIPATVQLGTIELVKACLERLKGDLILKTERANNYEYELAYEMIDFLPKNVRGAMALYRVTNA